MNEKTRILLIEDDEPSVRVMRLILEPEGYELDVSANRQEALTALGEQRPALVIMDYMMGGLAPSEFIDNARAIGFQGPILLCTAMHDDGGLQVDDVLFKPFDPDELSGKLSALLQQSRN